MLKRLLIFIVMLIILYTSFPFTEYVVHAEGETLRVAFNTNAVPYHFTDKDGDYKGMHIDMINWIAEQKNLNIVYVPYDTNDECLNALNSSSVDLILGHKTNDNAAKGLRYTNEMSSSSLCLIVPNELAETLKNTTNYRKYSAVIEYGSAPNSYMTKTGIQRYLAQGNQLSVFEALISGQADMALAVYDSCIYLLNERGLRDKYTILRSYISPVSYAMLVRQTDMALLNLLNSGLTEMRASGVYENIYKQWRVEYNQIFDPKTIRRIGIIAAMIACSAVAIALFNFVINRILKKKVAEKTKELQDVNAELDRRMIQIESESRIRYGMIEYAHSGMVSFDANYRIVLMNQAALKISNEKETCLGSDIRKLNVFGDILKNINYDIFSLNSYGEKDGHPVTLELGDLDKKRMYRYNLYRSRDESGISSVLLNVEDVTAEERKKQELFDQEKNRSINHLAAGIAHEIKNPLMAIRTAASLLKTQGNDPEVQEAFVKFIPNEVDRINQLIEGLINYARPIKRKSEVVNIAAVIRECLYLTNIAAKHDRVRFKIDLDDSAVIYVNKDRIKQSLINIILNGIESMEKKLQSEPNNSLLMTISIHKDTKFVWVYIRDEGVGMSETDIKRCTEPFYTTKTAGTGLGLALVKQFLEENDGILDICSKVGFYTEIMLKFRRHDSNEAQNINN